MSKAVALLSIIEDQNIENSDLNLTAIGQALVNIINSLNTDDESVNSFIEDRLSQYDPTCQLSPDEVISEMPQDQVENFYNSLKGLLEVNNIPYSEEAQIGESKKSKNKNTDNDDDDEQGDAGDSAENQYIKDDDDDDDDDEDNQN